ncbi:MAG: tetratricopeptide repeat protein [Verrucomicrobia bacterium]|jgi:Tfp pilus assembly protein PilF|nr:tetratricopeptide repeat protein [Verrucomicrobiota bacterium]
MAHTPSDLEAGLAAHTAGQMAAARARYERVLAREPDNSRAWFLLGNLHAAERRPALAIAAFERCVRLQPGQSAAHNSLGCAWLAVREVRRAEASFRQAIACAEPSAEAFSNLGALRRGEGDLAEAESLYRRALALRPDFAEVWCNLGVALREQGRFADAVGALQQALALKPDLAEAHFNESLLLLLQGDYRRGWEKHEYRWVTEQRGAGRDFSAPLWCGETSLEGRTILLHAEQGLGDTLQFIRYVPLLRQRGAEVMLEVQPALLPLLGREWGGARVFVRGERLPEFAWHCPLLSLPRACGTTVEAIPREVPYVVPPVAARKKWSELVPAAPGPRVGLVWFGNRQHKNDRNRSIPAAAIARFVAHCPCTLFSLQKGTLSREDAAVAGHPKLVNLTDRIADFSDTAALIEHLDLVIAVDTSVAHLAGAMGKPVWILLPQVPDWRWLLEREDSPWYPGARLFRQREARDWDSVLCRVRDELSRLGG